VPPSFVQWCLSQDQSENSFNAAAVGGNQSELREEIEEHKQIEENDDISRRSS
jgi:hypothetical protein